MQPDPNSHSTAGRRDGANVDLLEREGLVRRTRLGPVVTQKGRELIAQLVSTCGAK